MFIMWVIFILCCYRLKHYTIVFIVDFPVNNRFNCLRTRSRWTFCVVSLSSFCIKYQQTNCSCYSDNNTTKSEQDFFEFLLITVFVIVKWIGGTDGSLFDVWVVWANEILVVSFVGSNKLCSQSAWLWSEQDVNEQKLWWQVSHCNCKEYDKSNENEVKFCLAIPTQVSRFPVWVPWQALTGSTTS